MHRHYCCLLIVGLAAVCLVVSGCGPKTLGVEYVEGVVTLDGEPVSGATVMFTPVTQGEGAAATGITDEQGVYKLTAISVGDAKGVPQAGTLAGEYYVGVTKTETQEPMNEEEAYEKGIAYKPTPPGTGPPPKYIVPQKYNNPKESGIKVTVESGNNDIPIKLSSE